MAKTVSTSLGLVLMVTGLCWSGNLSAATRLARSRYVAGELLVKFRPDVPRFVRQEIHRGVGATVLQGFRGDSQLQRVAIPRGWGLEKALAYYATRADVQYVQPNVVYHTTQTAPGDTFFSYQYAWENSDGADVRATEAWDEARGRFTVIVASIDTGVDYLHPDLGLNIWTNPGEAGAHCYDGIDNDHNGFVDDCRGWNFIANNNDPRDDSNHGTHTSGTIGALTNNAQGVAGANWDVQIMPVKCFDSTGSGTTAGAISAIDYAVGNGAVVLNNSWGATSHDPALLEAIRRAQAHGVLFIASAGNTSLSGSNNDVVPFFPCSYSESNTFTSFDPPDNILCAASTDSNDDLAADSNFGSATVQLGAPGVSILSTIRSGGYAFMSGTSMATPHVTGGAALLKGCRATLNYASVKNILMQTARPDPALTGKTVTGGVVNYQDAIDLLLAGPSATCDAEPANQLPVADPGRRYNSNIRKAVQFDGTASFDPDGQVLLYFWDFGDGTAGVGAEPTHQYAEPGIYTVQLTVRDNLGGASSQTTVVTVRPLHRSGL